MINFTVLLIHFAIYLCLILFYEYVLSININFFFKNNDKKYAYINGYFMRVFRVSI